MKSNVKNLRIETEIYLNKLNVSNNHVVDIKNGITTILGRMARSVTSSISS